LTEIIGQISYRSWPNKDIVTTWIAQGSISKSLPWLHD